MSSWTQFCYLVQCLSQLPNVCDLVGMKVSVWGKLLKTVGKQTLPSTKRKINIFVTLWFWLVASTREKCIYYYSRFSTVMPQTIFWRLPLISLPQLLYPLHQSLMNRSCRGLTLTLHSLPLSPPGIKCCLFLKFISSEKSCIIPYTAVHIHSYYTLHSSFEPNLLNGIVSSLLHVSILSV